MIIEGLRNFNIPDAKPLFAEWLVPIDISEFLAGDSKDTWHIRFSVI